MTPDTSPCFVIGHYSQPNQNIELDEELSFIVKLIKKRYNNPNIVVAGDFNRNLRKVTILARKLGLTVCQSLDQQLITHLNTQMPERSNQLDYILANSPFEDTHVENNIWSNSDHKPLVSTTTLLSKPFSKHGKAIPVLKLLPSIRTS